MLDLLKKKSPECREFQEALESASSEAFLASTREVLLAGLNAASRTHADSCAACSAATDELLAARALLRALPAHSNAPAPWFASRVMAAIAAREADVRRAGSPWAAVPRFASRLALATAATLLVVSTWVYQRPVVPAKQTIADAAPEYLFESSPPPVSQDDILVSLAERTQ